VLEKYFLVVATVKILHQLLLKRSLLGTIITVVTATCFHVGFSFALFFDPEDGGDMFL
jgi:hypothetical protein